MNAAWSTRVQGPLGVVLACALAPFLAASSVPTAPLGFQQPSESRATADGSPAPDGGDDLSAYAVVPGTASGAEPRAAQAGLDGASGRVSPRGRLWSVSDLTDHGLPVAAKRAYQRAATGMAGTDPGCQLPWTLLAAIGRIESDHGRHGGARLGSDGVSRPRIIGLRLDGRGPVAAIRDTDDGRFDRDRVWDRAVGPMQFIPSTWASAARDGDGDGRRSPHDLDDAAAAAASYLCSGGGSLRDPATQAAAIFRYNQDDYYVALVQAFEVGYRTGSFVMPPPPPTEDEIAARHRARRAHHRARLAALREERAERRDRRERRSHPPSAPASARTGTATTDAAPSSEPAAKPAPTATSTPASTASPKPSTAPAPKPSPSPAKTPEPKPFEKTGAFTSCEGGYCLDGSLLDLGTLTDAGAAAHADFDLDGAAETNGAEVAGLLELQSVTMTVVETQDGRLGIYSINAKAVS